MVGTLENCLQRKEEEGGDDVKSSWPLSPGATHVLQWSVQGLRHSDMKPIPKTRSQFGSKSATRLREAGIASNRVSAMTR